jgi:hypothetical protein
MVRYSPFRSMALGSIQIIKWQQQVVFLLTPVGRLYV